MGGSRESWTGRASHARRFTGSQRGFRWRGIRGVWNGPGSWWSGCCRMSIIRGILSMGRPAGSCLRAVPAGRRILPDMWSGIPMRRWSPGLILTGCRRWRRSRRGFTTGNVRRAGAVRQGGISLKRRWCAVIVGRPCICSGRYRRRGIGFFMAAVPITGAGRCARTGIRSCWRIWRLRCSGLSGAIWMPVWMRNGWSGSWMPGGRGWSGTGWCPGRRNVSGRGCGRLLGRRRGCMRILRSGWLTGRNMRRCRSGIRRRRRRFLRSWSGCWRSGRGMRGIFI